jgi:hypothetical protein
MSNPPAASADAAWRRARSNRMAWLLGAFVIALYITGLFIQR